MLTHKLENKFYHNSALIKLNIPFNNVLLFYELQTDKAFTPEEKIIMGFDLLCSSRRKFSLAQKSEILQHVIKTYVVQSKAPTKSEKKLFDFGQDSSYIYSSFMAEYGIDLYKEVDKLDWRRFIWLFQGLSKDCKINTVIDIRQRKVPKPTKHNSDQVQALLELKTLYALELTEEERKQQFAESLKGLAMRYIKGAKNGQN